MCDYTAHCLFPQGCNCSPNEMCLQPVDGRTCNGDSGSFMGRLIGNQWQQQGIVSWGIQVSSCISLSVAVSMIDY